MAYKGQKFNSYSFETKKKAIEMLLCGMTKQEVADTLGIYDLDRLKVWMRKYREEGEVGLLDRRSSAHRNRAIGVQHIERAELKRDIIEKCIELLKREGLR